MRHRRGDLGAGETAAAEPAAEQVDAPGHHDPDPEVDVEAASEAEAGPDGEARTHAGTDEPEIVTKAAPAPKAAPVTATEPVEPATADGWSRGRARLTTALSRPGRGQVLAAVLLMLFGLAVVTQVRLVTQDSTYANARREDLIQLLDGLTQENRRLEGEQADLDRTKTNLQSGADAQQVAVEEAGKRIEVLSILAGTVPAQGQGIRMVITDPQGKVSAEILLDAVEEMRDAGAEVIEINDSIRLVASSSFGVTPDGQLEIDGKPVTRPIVMEVIGEPHSLAEGANFRGGIVSEITSSKVGGTVVITQLENVSIDSLHTPKDNQYARPSSPEPTR